MVGFEFATTHRVLVEAGAATRLPELCQQLGATRVMLVTCLLYTSPSPRD